MKKLLLLLLLWAPFASAHNYSREEILSNPNAPKFARLSVQLHVNYFEVLAAYEAYEKANPIVKLHDEEERKKSGDEEEEETDNWRFYFKHWNNQVSGLVRPDGSIIDIDSDSTLQRSIRDRQEKLRHQPAGSTAAKPTGLGWRLIGPNVHVNTNGDTANSQANIYAIHFNTSNPSIGYCGTETGYIFKTTNTGESWTLVGTGMIFSGGIRSVTTDPGNPNIVYAGDNSKIYKSTDGGTTWTIISSVTATPWSILVNPLRPQTLLAATDNGVYQSYDGGASFILRQSGKVTGIEYRPGDTSTVYAYVIKQVATASYPTGNFNAHVFKSTNGGQTFTIKPTGWFTYDAARKYVSMAGDLTVSANDSNVVYALLAGNEENPSSTITKTGEFGILKSVDAGETWSFVKGPFATPNMMTFPWDAGTFDNTYWQGNFNSWIFANPANSNEVIVGGLSGYRTTNGGSTWTNVIGYSSLYGTHPDHQNFFASGNTLWIANDGGILKSTDFLATAPKVKIKGIHASDFWGFAVGWNQEIFTGGRYHNGNASYYAGVNPDKTFIALGGGETPTGYVSPYEANVYHSDIAARKLTTTFPQVQNINNLTKFPNESYGQIGFSNMLFHPNKTRVLYMGRDSSFWRSNDGGLSFTALYTFTNNVADVDHPLSAPDTIMLTTVTDNKIWLSTNGGSSFTDVTGTLPAGAKKLSMNPVNAKECWVLVAGSGNVYRTTNSGASWTNVGGGALTGKIGRDILVQPGTTDPTCYIACQHSGVYYKNNSTAGNWIVLNQDLPLAHGIRRLEPFYNKNKMILATSGIGIWEHDLMNPVQLYASFASNRQTVSCSKDTLTFYDHSIVDESAAAAARIWSFPGASYVDTTNPKMPRVLYNAAGTYDVTLTVNTGGASDTRTLTNFIAFVGADICKVDSIPGLALNTNLPGTNVFNIGSAAINGNNFTISAWVKPKGNQISFSQILGTSSPNTYFGIGFAFNGYAPNLKLVYSHSSVSYSVNSTISLDSNVWNYITLVYTPTGVTIYKNGQAPGWTNTSGTFGNVNLNAGSLAINPDIHGQNGNFKGELDEIAFYNTALSLPQIREYMHLTKKDTTQHLVKYTQFNQYLPNEATAFDAIGGGAAVIPSGNIITSNAPVGSGSVATVNNVNAAGVYNFGTTGIAMTLPASGSYPNGTLVGFKLNVPPDTKPNTDSIFPNRTYWIVNNYGTNATFSTLSSIKFTGLPKNPAHTYTNNEFKLYKRPSGFWGNTWGNIQGTSDLVTVNPNNIDITFSANNNITSFSQLVLSANDPVALPIRNLRLTASLNPGHTIVKLDGKAEEIGEKIKLLSIERMQNNNTKTVAENDVSTVPLSTYSITSFDTDIAPGNRYYYRLAATTMDGKRYYGPYESISIPLLKGVFGAYPNPAGDWITFTFSNSEETSGTITLHDVSGRLIKQINVDLVRGSSSILCNISDLAHGIYQATLHLANGQTYHQKIDKAE